MTDTRRILALLFLPSACLAALSPSEQSALQKLDSNRVIAGTQQFSTGIIRTRSGAGAGTVVAGSEEEHASANVIEQDMKQLGLKTRQEPFAARAYQYGESR
jgi:hypothetical protein